MTLTWKAAVNSFCTGILSLFSYLPVLFNYLFMPLQTYKDLFYT
jgi:hypothetical protein